MPETDFSGRRSHPLSRTSGTMVWVTVQFGGTYGLSLVDMALRQSVPLTT